MVQAYGTLLKSAVDSIDPSGATSIIMRLRVTWPFLYRARERQESQELVPEKAGFVLYSVYESGWTFPPLGSGIADIKRTTSPPFIVFLSPPLRPEIYAC